MYQVKGTDTQAFDVRFYVYLTQELDGVDCLLLL